MKRYLLMAASAALFLASCSSEESVEINKGRSINFRSAITRGAEITTDGLTAFKATAIYEDNSSNKQIYFEDVEFTKNETGGTFTSENNYYWPNGTLNFIAYNPTTLDGTISTGQASKTLTGFSPKENIKDQYDFVSANAEGNRSDNEGDGVELKFEHRLSQIEIRAKSDSKIYTFKVKGIRIGQVASKSDYNFTSNTWTAPTDIVTYEVTYDTPKTLVPADKEAGAQSLMEGCNAMLLPQTTEKWVPDYGKNTTPHDTHTGSYISVLLQITMKADDNFLFYPFENQIKETGENYAWAAVPVKFDWAAGTKYIYTLDFTDGAGFVDPKDPVTPDEPILRPIKFTVQVGGWGTPADEAVNMDTTKPATAE